MRVEREAEAEVSDSLAAFQSASVTVLRQSTQVPKTSKKRHLGRGFSEDIVGGVD
jgi:hypothetical protein